MKLLHTSDWHLGKKLEGRDRLAEQRALVEELGRIADERACRAVLVAGDVFDVATPPAEAERLFYHALSVLSKNGRLVVVVAGNHDDPVRVACAACMLERQNVLVCSPEGFSPGLRLTGFEVLAQSRYTLLLEGWGEKLNLTCLCYPFNWTAENSADKSYTENLRALLETDVTGGRRILLSHLFAAGAQGAGDERGIEVGGLRVAEPSLFEPYDYVALGHIHRHQRVKNGCYSGSIAQYSFDERQEKGAVVYDTVTNGFEFVPLRSGRRLVRLSASGADEGMARLAECPEAYAELTLKLDRPLSFSENKLLKNFENLLSLRIELEERREEGRSYRGLRPEELFAAFWEQKHGKAPEAEVLAEFLDLLDEGGDVRQEAAAAEGREMQ